MWNKIDFFAKRILERLNSTQFKLFIVILAIYLYFINGFHSANELSRYSLILAIVEERRFIIDNYILNTIDISYYNGHYYSDKPPGLSFIGVPAYFFGRILLSSFWITNLLISIIAIFSALTVVLVYELTGFLGGTRTSKLLTALTYAFGTISWVYSKTFFAHGLSAFLLLLSMYCAYLFVQKNSTKFILISGVTMGYSSLVEYSNLLLVIPFLLYFIVYNTRKKLIYFLAPIILFLTILSTYHYVCFGSPFSTPLQHTSHFGNVQDISYFSNPVHIGLYGLLIGHYRGLFYLSPILLLTPFGFFYLYENYKPETFLLLSSFIIIVLFYSTYTVWDGGECYGPRFLLSVVPFFTLPLSQVIEKYKDQRRFLILFFTLMGYSILANAMGVIVSYTLGQDVRNPLLYNILYLLRGGTIDSHFFSVSPLTILVPIIAILVCTAPIIINYLHPTDV